MPADGRVLECMQNMQNMQNIQGIPVVPAVRVCARACALTMARFLSVCGSPVCCTAPSWLDPGVLHRAVLAGPMLRLPGCKLPADVLQRTARCSILPRSRAVLAGPMLRLPGCKLPADGRVLQRTARCSILPRSPTSAGPVV